MTHYKKSSVLHKVNVAQITFRSKVISLPDTTETLDSINYLFLFELNPNITF